MASKLGEDNGLGKVKDWIEVLNANQHEKELRIKKMNSVTQVKIFLIYAIFFLLLFVERGLFSDAVFVNNHPYFIVIIKFLSVIFCGLLLIPFVRIFMHSQAHWGVGNSRWKNFILDHFISVIYSVQQTGYKFGHFAHHRYDNDYDPRGYPKDLQSTYLFSTTGETCNPVVWVLFYSFIYQTAIHLMHVINSKNITFIGWYCIETIAIVLFHIAVFKLSATFYLAVYIPSLIIAWLAAGIGLYMMHNVSNNHYSVYHGVDAVGFLFNYVGDNDGYHIEHSLFPALHPAYLKEAHEYMTLPKEQIVHDYILDAFIALFHRYRRHSKNH